ncbi:TIGR02444 family protein [Undibacter mobilis]|uniref:TIGR02444 family protein n=1 Tax=Undibacter mobilis TaxID=2292256 RepID=A0A371BAM2_9BRAD|nr:TIGR02444 family protein [Undibacter mobilis]RDV04557.1 TIGR02444 family protein [Undibacter mobilis]
MMSFWDFSNAVYMAPGVANECLQLQDEFDVDVNVLLFCAYAAVIAGVRLSEQNLHDADSHIADLRRGVIAPLRACRRAMKVGIAALSSGDRDRAEQLRSQVKAIEIAAEQIEQERLAAWLAANTHMERGELPGALDDNLAALFAPLERKNRVVPVPAALVRAALAQAK